MGEKMTLLPCPFCGHAELFDQWPCEWLDGSGVNVVRCPMCHGAAPEKCWNRRHLTQPAQAVDVGAIEAVIRELCKWPKDETLYDHRATRLACAEKLRAFIRTHHATLADMAKRLEAAARDAKDARRYRFIRDKQATIIYKRKGHGVWEPLIDTRETSTRCASLDEAVDAAIDATQEGEG